MDACILDYIEATALVVTATGIVVWLSYSLGRSIRIHEGRIRVLEDTIKKHKNSLNDITEDLHDLDEKFTMHMHEFHDNTD